MQETTFIKLICAICVSMIAMTFFDRVLPLPPCKVCGSREVKQNNTKIDWFGRWKGEWTCENDHRNAL